MISVYAVSDGSGTTARGVVRAALTQFDPSQVMIIRRGNVRTPQRIYQIIEEATSSGGFIVHTLVSTDLRGLVYDLGRERNVTTIDLMGPMLSRLSDLFSIEPRSVPGLYQSFDDVYLRRIEAIDFTVRHDDGQNIDDIDQAEIILVGVSRTAKTPISIYLSLKGWKVANVPLILGVEPPGELFNSSPRKVIGLYIQPERLALLRKARTESMGSSVWGYADLEHIQKEIAFSLEIFARRPDWKTIEVTAKPIEESASEIISILGSHLTRGNGPITLRMNENE